MSGQLRCITLLTDYGFEAGFVGTLHAVAFRIAPAATVIDLDHSIPPGNVRLGALRLERLVRFLPAGVHVAVVDPGVGTARRPIAVRAGRQLFVGPDNGLLVWGAEAAGGIDEAVLLDDETYFLEDRASTFDGRDVFVPVAAHLLTGRPLGQVGSPIDSSSLVVLERPCVSVRPDGTLATEVVQVDGFGNVQLGARARDVDVIGLRRGDRLVVAGGDGQVEVTFGTTFSDVGTGEALVLVDSDGQLSLAVNGGRADQLLTAPLGAPVVISRSTSPGAGTAAMPR